MKSLLAIELLSSDGMAAQSAKCLLCASEYVVETEEPHMPFVCMDCGAWGMTADTIDNPAPDDDWNPTGQVPRRPTE